MSAKNQLVNTNQERFCQLVASGTNATAAYLEVYGTESTGAASKLRNKPHIAARISEILAGGVIKAKLRGAQVIEELARLAMSNIADVLDIQEDGSAIVDLQALTREQAAAISEIESVTLTDPRTGIKKVRTKVKLFDKKGPLDTLAKHFGLLIDKHEHGAPGDFSRSETIEDIAAKIKRELGEEDAAKFLKLVESKKEQEAEPSSMPPVIVPNDSSTRH